ncbi:MAG: helix-turn-helix transcriptional regulator [Rickettsiales bacterium]|jgi:transcriptional regulator with XRE-family HTH domain|nr:helix-turn-helix transcriptional regulator [Rickettsiales bacterium]
MEEIIFPNKIRILRKMSGKSMQDLADRLDVSLSAISKIEKGYRKINQEQMMTVADFLGCAMTDIFISEDQDDEAILGIWKKEIERRVNQNQNKGLKIFGAGLRFLRSSKDLTLMDVADAAGLTLSVYHRIEIGQREIYEPELDSIARSLGMTSRDVLSKIYELKEDGSLDRFMNSVASPIESIAKMSDILKTTESVYTPGGVVKFHKVLMYSKTLENGDVLVEKSRRDYATYPVSDKKVDGIYAIELSSRRLGNILPMRSILFLDPNQAVRSGDIAAQVISDSDDRAVLRLISVREDIDGKFYGVSYNPDDKKPLSGAELAGLHRVVLVSMN